MNREYISNSFVVYCSVRVSDSVFCRLDAYILAYLRENGLTYSALNFETEAQVTGLHPVAGSLSYFWACGSSQYIEDRLTDDLLVSPTADDVLQHPENDHLFSTFHCRRRSSPPSTHCLAIKNVMNRSWLFFTRTSNCFRSRTKFAQEPKCLKLQDGAYRPGFVLRFLWGRKSFGSRRERQKGLCLGSGTWCASGSYR